MWESLRRRGTTLFDFQGESRLVWSLIMEREGTEYNAFVRVKGHHSLFHLGHGFASHTFSTFPIRLRLCEVYSPS